MAGKQLQKIYGIKNKYQDLHKRDFLWSVIQKYLQMFTLRLNVILSKFYGQ